MPVGNGDKSVLFSDTYRNVTSKKSKHPLIGPKGNAKTKKNSEMPLSLKISAGPINT